MSLLPNYCGPSYGGLRPLTGHFDDLGLLSWRVTTGRQDGLCVAALTAKNCSYVMQDVPDNNHADFAEMYIGLECLTNKFGIVWLLCYAQIALDTRCRFKKSSYTHFQIPNFLTNRLCSNVTSGTETDDNCRFSCLLSAQCSLHLTSHQHLMSATFLCCSFSVTAF